MHAAHTHRGNSHQTRLITHTTHTSSLDWYHQWGTSLTTLWPVFHMRSRWGVEPAILHSCVGYDCMSWENLRLGKREDIHAHTHTQEHIHTRYTHRYNVVIVTVRIYIDMTCTMYILPVTSLSPLKKWRQSGDLSGSSACLTTLLLLLERLLSQQAIGCVTPRMTHFYLAPSRHLFWLERLLSQRE